MIPAREVVAGIAGALQLAKFDVQGLAFFDDTEGRFWLSFYAAVIIAPLFLILITLQYLNEPSSGGYPHFIILEMLAYVISWLAFPVIMAYLVKSLDRQARYFRFIAAYNWASVLQNGIYLPIAILAITGALSADAANFLALIALSWVLAYTFFITRRALDVPPGTAAAIVFMNFLLGLLIEAATGKFV